MKIIELEEVDSTNEYCKRYDGGEDLIVFAERQTKGKGTKGRSFISDGGGIYVSTLKHYRNFDFSKTFSIMINSCVAVCRTVESFALTPVIRWANDVLVGGKKICGTLIENTFGAGGVCTSVVGIGLNVNNVLPPELKDIATTLNECLGCDADIDRAKRALIDNLSKSYTVDDYKRYINWFGQSVSLNCGGESCSAVALDVDESGNLICDICGETKTISSAEISLRLKK